MKNTDRTTALIALILVLSMIFTFTSCGSSGSSEEPEDQADEIAEQETDSTDNTDPLPEDEEQSEEQDQETEEKAGFPEIGNEPQINAGETASERSVYIDVNGDYAFIPSGFTVSLKGSENKIANGLVVTGPDGSEYVWVPTTVTPLEREDFGVYFYGSASFSEFYDETDLEEYQDMVKHVEKYGGFYISRYEVSRGENNTPMSTKVNEGDPRNIWIQLSPQDATYYCEQLYSDNDTVQGFFPWGINWDTTLMWLVDSGCKTYADVKADSTSWGNYSDDKFSPNERGLSTGKFEETKANNIYDLAGNNWEWTQERAGQSYVMRGGGYNLMGGACEGSVYTAAIRDALPGNDHHPNVVIRSALYVI